jgi:hypothetical protein
MDVAGILVSGERSRRVCESGKGMEQVNCVLLLLARCDGYAHSLQS